ncbi:hypothetical protein [Oceanobacillus luteolus]|uniref:Uncharacterized protein n=1 Tax=Oceanobacillus luteolus TaxID=1274358 RepID=A0ABW4HPC5_9BACI
MKCKCGGILDIIRIENPPGSLSEQEKLAYKRVCDVQCLECGKVYYSQPYDFGNKFNTFRDLNND